MRQEGGEVDQPVGLVDRGGLDDGDLVLAKAFAHDVEPARQRGIAEGAGRLRGGTANGGWQSGTFPG